MSDHTPTTEEVRERFVDGFPMDTWLVARETLGAQFDRWLSGVIRQKQAESWDEGAQYVLDMYDFEPYRDKNPYRNGADHE